MLTVDVARLRVGRWRVIESPVTGRARACIVSGMPSSRSSRVGRLAAEFAVIVVGVLIALFAESWWSERDERAYEAELLDDMVEEFQENLAILESDRAINDSIRGGWARILDDGPASLLAMDEATLEARLANTRYWAGFDPAMGTVRSIVANGDLSVIRDRELRYLLSRWAGLIEENTRKRNAAVTGQTLIMSRVLVDAAEDARWSEGDRRRLYRALHFFVEDMDIVMLTQRRLHESALEILAYLEGAGLR